MDLVILFDWFTNESMDAALQATEWPTSTPTSETSHAAATR
jgi:hypothetical protein